MYLHQRYYIKKKILFVYTFYMLCQIIWQMLQFYFPDSCFLFTRYSITLTVIVCIPLGSQCLTLVKEVRTKRNWSLRLKQTSKLSNCWPDIGANALYHHHVWNSYINSHHTIGISVSATFIRYNAPAFIPLSRNAISCDQSAMTGSKASVHSAYSYTLPAVDTFSWSTKLRIDNNVVVAALCKFPPHPEARILSGCQHIRETCCVSLRIALTTWIIRATCIASDVMNDDPKRSVSVRRWVFVWLAVAW